MCVAGGVGVRVMLCVVVGNIVTASEGGGGIGGSLKNCVAIITAPASVVEALFLALMEKCS